MTRSASASIERPRFDEFLFAPIGYERNGMLLSVLSALARLDVDPWREAASLAQMSNEAAATRMTSLIAALPDGPSTCSDPAAIADRLVALLPRQGLSKSIPSSAPLRAHAANNSRFVIFIALMVFLLGAQFLLRTFQSPAQSESARSPASVAAAPPTSTPWRREGESPVACDAASGPCVARSAFSEIGALDKHMREYFAVIIQESDMDFSVRFPDLPGCVATAATFEKARAVAGKALASHLSNLDEAGDPIPQPSTLEAVVGGEDEQCGAAILIQEAKSGAWLPSQDRDHGAGRADDPASGHALIAAPHGPGEKAPAATVFRA
jgi:predicted RNase H-like HicB family nuclease